MHFPVDSDLFDPFLFLELRAKQIRDACGRAGVDRCTCMNKAGAFANSSSLFYDENPVEAALTHLTCVPDFCYCKWVYIQEILSWIYRYLLTPISSYI